MKRVVLGTIIFALAVGTGAYFLLRKPAEMRHVFINETSDHRFDESIEGSILASYDRTRVQNAVVITETVKAVDIAQEAARLFKKLRLGESTHGRAILYLFNPAERALKIEVGYALEGALPDIEVSFLEKAAKSFTFKDRMQDFWAELINTLNIEIQDRETHRERESSGFDFKRFTYFSGGAGVAAKDYDSSPEQLEREMRKLPVDGGSRFKPGSDVATTLKLYLESMQEGIGDSGLPLLSDESRLFRSFTPQTSYQLFRNWRMMQQAGIDRTIIDRKMAYVFFRPGKPVLPLVFTQTEDGWKVVEPLSWALFNRYENSNRVFLKFPLLLTSIEALKYVNQTLGQPIYKAPQVLPSEVLQASQSDPLTFYQLRLFWPEKTTRAFEQQPITKHSDEDLYIGMDGYIGQGRMSAYADLLGELVRRHPGDLSLKENYEFYRKISTISPAEWQLHF